VANPANAQHITKPNDNCFLVKKKKTIAAELFKKASRKILLKIGYPRWADFGDNSTSVRKNFDCC